MAFIRKYLPLITIGLSISIVLKVPQIRDFAFEEFIEGLNLNHQDYGFLCSVGGLVTCSTYILSGIIIDMFNLKKVMMVSLVCCAVALVLMAMSPSFSYVLLSYGLLCFFGMSLFWCAAIKCVCVIYSKKDQPLAYSLVEAIRGGTGFFIAIIATFLFIYIENAETALSTALMYFALLHIAIAFFIYKVLPNNMYSKPEKITLDAFMYVLKQREIWAIISIVCGIYIIFILMSYTSLYMERICNIDENLIGFLSSFRTFVIALVAAPVGGFITRKMKSPVKVIATGSFCVIALLASLFFVEPENSYKIVIAVIIFLALVVFAIKGIQFSTLSSTHISAKYAGLAIGIICTFAYMPESFIFTLVGMFLEHFSEATAFNLIFALMILASCLCLVGLLLLCNISIMQSIHALIYNLKRAYLNVAFATQYSTLCVMLLGYFLRPSFVKQNLVEAKDALWQITVNNMSATRESLMNTALIMKVAKAKDYLTSIVNRA